MRSVKFIDSSHEAILGVFKSAFIYRPGDKVVILDRMYEVTGTIKYVYFELEEDEIEFVSLSPIELESKKPE